MLAGLVRGLAGLPLLVRRRPITIAIGRPDLQQRPFTRTPDRRCPAPDPCTL